jgi:multidrug efflux pump subunit AcrA (membrane-fusion protein)
MKLVRHSRWSCAALVLVVLTLCACNRASKSDEESGGEGAANPVLAVSVAKVSVGPMSESIRILGTTAAMHHVILRAPVAGRVLGMHVKLGDQVHRGEIIAHVLSHEVEAAQQGLEIARKIDPQDAPSLEHSLDKYKHDSGLPVSAPDSGIVSAPPVTTGQVVNYLDPLVDLIDPASVYVDAAVPVGEVYLIKAGMPAVVRSPLKPATEMPARVAAILPNFNAGSATSAVRIEFTGSERIVEAGAPVEATVIARSVPNAIVIPVAALFQDSGGSYHVFVAGPDGRAHRVPVTLGLRTEQQAQVLSGLRPGETVITSGGYALSDGLRVGVVQAGR